MHKNRLLAKCSPQLNSIPPLQQAATAEWWLLHRYHHFYYCNYVHNNCKMFSTQCGDLNILWTRILISHTHTRTHTLTHTHTHTHTHTEWYSYHHLSFLVRDSLFFLLLCRCFHAWLSRSMYFLLNFGLSASVSITPSSTATSLTSPVTLSTLSPTHFPSSHPSELPETLQKLARLRDDCDF